MGGASANLWPVGVGLQVVATVFANFGKQMIRLSELKKISRPRLSRTYMALGLLTNTVLAPILDMGAYSFAAQSLIAPFGGLDVVWNALFAPCVLKETLTCRRLIGCILIMIGTALAGGFGNHSDFEYTLDFLEETLVSVRVLLYLIAFLVWFQVNRLCLMKYPRGSAVRGVSLGCTAGTIAGNMFCLKAAVELIQRSIVAPEEEIWLHWLPYVVIVGAIFFALTNVIYMTQGLKEYEALFMVTIYEGSMIVSGCVSGAVVLLDLRGLAFWRVALYCLSVVVIVVGMYVIFSQEAMSKSSLMAGRASIQQTPKALRRRSFHAACDPSSSSGSLTGELKVPVGQVVSTEPTQLEGGEKCIEGHLNSDEHLLRSQQEGSRAVEPSHTHVAVVPQAQPGCCFPPLKRSIVSL